MKDSGYTLYWIVRKKQTAVEIEHFFISIFSLRIWLWYLNYMT